jgi:predicted metal-dependent HD superfamily phosphohydrolase
VKKFFEPAFRKAGPARYNRVMARMPEWDAQLPAELADELRTRHAEPQRAYHTWRHIEELLALYRETEPQLDDPRAVLFAVLFHDAVYDPRSNDNERSSAELLAQRAAGLLPPDSLARAERMVLATVGHSLPAGLTEAERADAAHFLDMDLSILGAAPARFAEYETQIRREYAHIPEDTYRTGRAAMLQRFARRDPLYFSDWGRGRFEAQARINLARLVDELRSDPAAA